MVGLDGPHCGLLVGRHRQSLEPGDLAAVAGGHLGHAVGRAGGDRVDQVDQRRGVALDGRDEAVFARVEVDYDAALADGGFSGFGIYPSSSIVRVSSLS